VLGWRFGGCVGRSGLRAQGKSLDPFWLSQWRWKRPTFERDFDRILLERVDPPRLQEILRALGSTTLDCWLDMQ
jgi:hypothetical protein